MFHEGTLQDGIARAIQEQKLVACFVRDESDESATWENEWLQNGWISNLLEQKAVTLRLESGSTEAGFLAAFCPVTNIPTFIIIHNGQLREQLVAGVDRDEFINRIRKVLGADPIPVASRPSNSTPQTSTPVQAQTSPPSTRSEPVARADDFIEGILDPVPAPASEPVPAPAPAPAPAATPAEHHPVSPILPPSAKAKGKQKAASPSPNPSKSSPTAQQTARDALRKKKQQEKEDLARIQARIAADKAERKAQSEARKAERSLLASPTTPSTSTSQTGMTRNKSSQSPTVHLSIRLFDGRTIRSTFPRTASLQQEVRSWIDQEFTAMNEAENPGSKHPPYYFRQILAPQPSRELTAGEESETLGDLELAPSATLVLIPVKGYTDAYDGGNGGGIVGGVVGGVTGLVGGVFGLAYNAVGYVGGALGSVVGYGGAQGDQTTEQQDAQEHVQVGRPEEERRPPREDGVRVRTFADQRDREPRREFYNGNQTNFEPNHED